MGWKGITAFFFVLDLGAGLEVDKNWTVIQFLNVELYEKSSNLIVFLNAKKQDIN